MESYEFKQIFFAPSLEFWGFLNGVFVSRTTLLPLAQQESFNWEFMVFRHTTNT